VFVLKYPQYSKVENGRPNKVIVLCMLIIDVILVCVSSDVSFQELGRTVFLEGVFGRTHIYKHNKFTRKKQGALRIQKKGTEKTEVDEHFGFNENMHIIDEILRNQKVQLVDHR